MYACQECGAPADTVCLDGCSNLPDQLEADAHTACCPDALTAARKLCGCAGVAA